MPGWTPPPPASRRSNVAPQKGVDILNVRWDETVGVVFVSHPQGLLLETPEEVEQWGSEVFAKLGVIEAERGSRFPIVVCLDGVTIRPNVAAEYGSVVRTYAERFASGLARYTRRPNGVNHAPDIRTPARGGAGALKTCPKRQRRTTPK